VIAQMELHANTAVREEGLHAASSLDEQAGAAALDHLGSADEVQGSGRHIGVPAEAKPDH
jgi:hypothetical protein